MKYPALVALISVVLAVPANAEGICIKFDGMKVGTRLVTQSLSGKKRILSEKYIGKRDGFHVMEVSTSANDGTMKFQSNTLYDAKGRRVRIERKKTYQVYTLYSCFFALGACSHTNNYPNPFTKKKSKRTQNFSRYKNRLDGGMLFIGTVLNDGSVTEYPYKLGPYNLRMSSEYKNALGQVRGFKLIELVEP